MIRIKNDGIIPDKTVFLRFALKAKRMQAHQYDIDFGIERFSCSGADEINRKDMILKGNLNDAFRCECYKKGDVALEYQAMRDRVFAELLSSVGVITLIDKKTGNRLEISYHTNGEAVFLHGHKALLFWYPSEIGGKDYSIDKTEQRKYLSSFLKKITYEFLPETLEEKNNTELVTAEALTKKLPSELAMHVGTFLTKKEGACLTGTCGSAANTSKNQTETKGTAVESRAVSALVAMSHAVVSSHNTTTSSLATAPRRRCVIM